MSTTLHLGTQFTLVEAAKRVHNGAMLPMAEILSKSMPVLGHIPWFEANDQFSNKTLQRYNLPVGTWRQFNAGVASETSQGKQITDTMGMLASYWEGDCDLVDSMPSPETYRQEQNAAFVEGFGQTMTSQLWYGNALVDAEKWTGLAPRMASLNGKTVQGCGGATTLTSIFLVQWGPGKVYGIFPKGSAAGLQHEPKDGKQTKVDSNGLMWEVYRDYYSWKAGLVVENPRCIARVANMEPTGATTTFDEEVLISVKNWMKDQGRGAIAYCSTNMYSQIMIAINAKSNVFHPVSNPFGPSEVPSLLGIPIFVDEMILETETVIA